mmetsp:Transcript_59344/g.190940  ORF Transcript_59344/g.190940 Transcript_59344/m.190940 type:complete len:648 (+) Transcript_59344:56-1999(+)
MSTGEFATGDRVRIVGLTGRPGLNSKLGTLGKFDEAKGRWEVYLDLGEAIKAKPANIERKSLVCQATFASSLRFDNSVLARLPVDPEGRNFVRESVPGACWSRVRPTPLRNPRLVVHSPGALELLGLAEAELAGKEEELAVYLGGCEVLPGADPAAHCYCGHQFGSFSGQLGDGATMYLGEVINPAGERWELQFKGAGKTPYSRKADGRKVLRSSVREFLCSEAMHHLGVPTTRAGTCVVGDDMVVRDIYYDGNSKPELCAVITRIAPTFIRFGSFEIFKERDEKTGRAGPSAGNTALLRKLLDLCVEQYYPQAWAEEGPGEPRYLRFFAEVVRRTAELVAAWQAVGWVHGVLNTDNMSILGLTIDYGPFGFMEWFDQDYNSNGSDGGGRYSYGRQPEVCKWNCGKFAEALAPLLPPAASGPVLERYDEWFQAAYLGRMRAKLGLDDAPERGADADPALIEDLLKTMESTCADWSLVFRALCSFDPNQTCSWDSVLARLTGACAGPDVCASLLRTKAKMSKTSMPPEQVSMLWQTIQQGPERLRQNVPAARAPGGHRGGGQGRGAEDGARRGRAQARRGHGAALRARQGRQRHRGVAQVAAAVRGEGGALPARGGARGPARGDAPREPGVCPAELGRAGSDRGGGEG